MKVFDFSNFVTDRTRGFIGREWVFDEIDRWLVDPLAPRLFILTGEPGVGKSALAARLTQVRRIDAVHFCIARQSPTIDPLNFVRSISHQLTCIDDFAIKILDEQGIKVDVRINVQENYGQIIGVQINNLVIGSPSATEALIRSVIDPIRKLYASGTLPQLLLLVDALDEAIQYPGRETIIDLIANVSNLPPQVRFVLTSRPEGAVLRHFEQQKIPYFLLDAGREENLNDIRAYIRSQYVDLPELKTRLDQRSISLQKFEDALTASSQGNFLYLTWVLPGVAKGTQPIDDLARLPVGLDEIYREFLRTRTLGKDIRQWRNFRPLLGVLAVAQGPLSADQLGFFTRLDAQTVADFVMDAGQFLDPTTAQDGFYELYHQSLVDFLGDQKRAEEFWIDLQSMHPLIIQCYKGGSPTWADVDWGDVDDYGILHLGTHLFALREMPAYHQELYGLICHPFMREKRRRTSSNRAFANDVTLMIQAAEKEPEPNLPQVARGTLLYSTLGSIATGVRPEILALLSQLGRVVEAVDLAALIQVKEQQYQAYLQIGEVLVKQNGGVQPRELANQALEAASAIRDDSPRSEAFSWIAQFFARLGEPEQALAVCDSIKKETDYKEALGVVAQAFAFAGDLDGAMKLVASKFKKEDRNEILKSIVKGLAQAQAFGQALKKVRDIHRQPHLDESLGAIAQSLAENMQIGRALQVAQRIEAFSLRATTLLEITKTLARKKEYKRALQVANKISDKSVRVQSVGTIAQSQVLAGEVERLAETLEDLIPERLRAIQVAQQVIDSNGNGAFDWMNALAFLRVADSLFQSGNEIQARDVAILALKTARNIGDVHDQAVVMCQAIETLKAWFPAEEIKALFEEALTAIKAIEKDDARIQELFRIVQVAYQAGYRDRALELMDQVHREVASWIDGETRLLTLGDVALYQAHIGARDQALNLADEIFQAVEIQDPWTITTARIKIVQAYMALEAFEKANAAFQSALSSVDAIQDVQQRAAARTDLIYCYLWLFESHNDWHLIDQAIEDTMQIEDPGDRAAGLDKIIPCVGRALDEDPGSYWFYRAQQLAALAFEATASIEEPFDRIEIECSLIKNLLQIVESIPFYRYELQSLKDLASLQLEGFRDVVNSIEEVDSKAFASIRVAMAYFLSGNLGQAEVWMDQAQANAMMVSDDSDRVFILSEIAQNLAFMASQESSSPAMSNTLLDIAKTLSFVGDKDQASRLANQAIQSSFESGQYELDKVMLAFALSDRFEDTLEIGRSNEKSDRGADRSQNTLQVLLKIFPPDRPGFGGMRVNLSISPLADCAVSLVEAAELEKAMALVEIIKDQKERDNAMIRMSQSLIQFGFRSQAEEIINEMLFSLESLKQDKAEMVAFRSMVHSFLGAKCLDYAIEVTEEIWDKECSLDATSGLVTSLVIEGKLPVALDLVMGVKNPEEKAMLLCRLAQACIQQGRRESATSIMEQASGLLTRVRSRRERIICQAQIAQAWFQSGMREKSDALQNQTLADVASKEFRSNQDNITVNVSLIQMLVTTGREKEALQRLKQSFDYTKRLKEGDRAQALVRLAKALTGTSLAEPLDRIAAQARVIRSRRQRVTALSGVVHSLSKSGRIERALLEARQLLEIAETIKNERDRVAAFREIVLAVDGPQENGMELISPEQVVRMAEKFKDERARLDAWRIALKTLDPAGFNEHSLGILLIAFDLSRQVGRDAYFSVLADGADLLVKQDQGETLWKIFQSVQEIDSWWEPAPSIGKF